MLSLKNLHKELTQPANLSLAFNIVGDAIGLPPLINKMIITAFLGAFDGFNENPQNRVLGLFKGMFNNFFNASVRVLTLGLYDPAQGGWNSNWDGAYYMRHIIDFITTVEEHGIETAIENHLTTMFTDEAIRVINERGGIRDFLTGDAEMVEEDGVVLKRIHITDDEKLYLHPDTNDVIGRDYKIEDQYGVKIIRERGKFGISPISDGFGLIDGTFEQELEDGTRMRYSVTDSVIVYKMEVIGANGVCRMLLAPDPEKGFTLDNNGIPLGAIVMDFDKGEMYNYEYLGNNLDFEINFDHPNVDIQNVVSVDFSNLTDEQKEEVLNYYLVMNGIGNQNPYNSPQYMFNFGIDLANADPLTEDITLIPLFNDAIPTITLADLANVVDDAAFLMQDLRDFGYIDENGYRKHSMI